MGVGVVMVREAGGRALLLDARAIRAMLLEDVAKSAAA